MTRGISQVSPKQNVLWGGSLLLLFCVKISLASSSRDQKGRNFSSVDLNPAAIRISLLFFFFFCGTLSRAVTEYRLLRVSVQICHQFLPYYEDISEYQLPSSKNSQFHMYLNQLSISLKHPSAISVVTFLIGQCFTLCPCSHCLFTLNLLNLYTLQQI